MVNTHIPTEGRKKSCVDYEWVNNKSSKCVRNMWIDEDKICNLGSDHNMRTWGFVEIDQELNLKLSIQIPHSSSSKLERTRKMVLTARAPTDTSLF
jgi:hypothetical protein